MVAWNSICGVWWQRATELCGAAPATTVQDRDDCVERWQRCSDVPGWHDTTGLLGHRAGTRKTLACHTWTMASCWHSTARCCCRDMLYPGVTYTSPILLCDGHQVCIPRLRHQPNASSSRRCSNRFWFVLVLRFGWGRSSD
ncbi:hypothetical protein BS78_02G217200 [Paspalum vaginatum]|nr:hypothetical protein BS78_02G217200 [Paspalum vaginatum]